MSKPAFRRSQFADAGRQNFQRKGTQWLGGFTGQTEQAGGPAKPDKRDRPGRP